MICSSSRALIVGSVILVCVGCDSKDKATPSVIAPTRRQRIEVSQDNYEQACRAGNVDKARASLLEQAACGDNLGPDPFYTIQGEAMISVDAYSLLYCLEKRLGNQDAADADLIKVKYWWLRSAELGGNKISEKIMVAQAESIDDAKITNAFGKGDMSALLVENAGSRSGLAATNMNGGLGSATTGSDVSHQDRQATAPTTIPTP